MSKPTTFDYIEDYCSHFREAWDEYYKCEEEEEWPCEPPDAYEEEKCVETAIEFFCDDYPEECE